MDVNVQEDLNAINDQITKLVEELNKMTAARENLVTQVQNLNGVAMYLRGKLPPEEASKMPTATTVPQLAVAVGYSIAAVLLAVVGFVPETVNAPVCLA